ncbi:hypothetical protein [Salinibacterium sp. PAMC 21357]|uniref:hypothetical protein n=1 Tax=Salinibacterium sp. PAMC 21357 TaxID=1112215 RepID=UPI00028902F0|nr:hypothetical protein [Salinibacterium sp. PAMC 21357]
MRLPNLVRGSVGMLLLASLSGCTPTDAPAPPEPISTFVAPYATDEEALAAAEVAYAEYVRVSSEILNEGGVNPERLAEVVTGEFLESSIEGLKEFHDAGRTQSGASKIGASELQRYSPTGGPREIVTIYVCRNISEVGVFDSSGISIVAPERADSSTMQVTFDYVEAGEALLVSDQLLWGDGEC